jgi:DnaJ-class molecular chaperone
MSKSSKCGKCCGTGWIYLYPDGKQTCAKCKGSGMKLKKV